MFKILLEVETPPPPWGRPWVKSTYLPRWGFIKLKKTFGKQSFRYLSKIKFDEKNFSQKPPPPPKKFKKMTKYSFICKFFTR